jgi:hypothetical protein
VNLQALENPLSLCGREGLIERGAGMGVEVVHDEDNAMRFGIPLVDESFYEPGPILSCPLLCHFHMPPSRKRLEGQKKIRHSIALVLTVVALHFSRLGGDRKARFLQQLLAALVHADQRQQGIKRARVHFENILHTIDKLCTVQRRNAPALLQVGLDLVFFRVRRTVS